MVPRSPVNVLLVDDQTRNLLALRATLETPEVNLELAHSGPDALRQVLARDFAVIVLDVNMPGMGGVETAGLIHARARSRLTPIIFLTADDDRGAPVLEGYRAGAIDYIHKPFNSDILRSKVGILVDLFRNSEALAQSQAELVDANQRLVVAGVEAMEQTETQIGLRAQAEAEVKMRDEFMSIAAHELRTPLTGIKAGAQLGLQTLGSDKPDLRRATKYLALILGGANRLVVLINDLMDVSRIHSGQLMLSLVPIDFATLVLGVALRCAGAAEEHHHITTEVPVAPVMVLGETGRLEQVLDNLIGNAVKYSPLGGEIRVRLLEVVDGIVLSIGDDGIGLSPGAHEHIFEPFGRAANATEQGVPGMGLGLHICRQIAQAHGGRMWAESAGEGKGMTVRLWLPLT
jgi:signal transduction histidine kinase